MSTEERLVAIADQRAGRVIPSWRYWLAYVLIPVAWIVSPVVQLRVESFWLRSLILIAILFAFSALLDKFKRRSIR